MEKYTLEHLRTRFKPQTGMKWVAVDWKEGEEYAIFSNECRVDYVLFGTKIINNEEHILFEESWYKGTNHFAVPISEFRRLGLLIEENTQEMNIEKPKTFWITGKEHQIAAIKQDLLELGYTLAKSSINGNNIGCNWGEVVNTREDYLELFSCNSNYTSDKEIGFTLPQDYSKALEHAQKAINSPYWTKEEYKVGDYVYIKDDGFEI